MIQINDIGGLHSLRKSYYYSSILVILLLILIYEPPGSNATGPMTCRVGELRCQNGELCVSREKVCDGIRQCSDGLDEYVCKFRRGLYRMLQKYHRWNDIVAGRTDADGITQNMKPIISMMGRSGPKTGAAVFQCQFGGVIPLSMLCNGAVNCLDGSDESEICENNSCLPGQFRCAYGACIQDWRLCNGRVDCPDGSDETAESCESIKCNQETEFQCRYGGCIRKTQICDVKKHCADGSDESEFLCLITRAKMLSQWEQEAEEESKMPAKDKRKKAPTKSQNSVLPSPMFSRVAATMATTPSSISTLMTEKPDNDNDQIAKTTSNSTSKSINKKVDENQVTLLEKDGKQTDESSMLPNSPKLAETSSQNKKDSFDNSPESTTSSSINSESANEGGSSTTIITSTIPPTTTTTTTEQPTVTCVLPEIPENADAVVSHCIFDGKPCDENMQTVSISTQIHYECDAGYSLYGAPVITCQDDGKWSLTPPICEVILDVRFGLGSIIPKDFRPRCSSIIPTKGSAVECLDPSNLAVKSCSELQKPGVEARLTCKAYYRPAGDLPVHYEKCGEDGHWSPGTFQQFSCVPDCGLSEVPKTPFIVNGKSIRRGQWPWHVGIFVEHKGELTYICGGALISENAIITSAHCVTRHGSVLDPKKFKVFLGKQSITIPDTDPFVQSRHISKIFVEDAFNFRSLDSDIAIMALETPAVLSYFVRPVCYPQSSNSFLEEYQLAQGNLGTVLGWGYTENQTLSPELRMIELPVVSQKSCVEAYRDFFASMTRSTNYCAGYLNGTSLCNGDSGGGQYFKAIVKGATRWYIQGLVSYGVPKEGSKQCSSSHYTVFTRVGRYADWVVRTLSRENLI